MKQRTLKEINETETYPDLVPVGRLKIWTYGFDITLMNSAVQDFKKGNYKLYLKLEN